MDLEKLMASLEAVTNQKASELNETTQEPYRTGSGGIEQDYDRGVLVVDFGGRALPELAMVPEQAFVFGMSVAKLAMEMIEKERSNEPG